MIGKAARVFRKFLDFLGLISGLAQNSIFALKLDLLQATEGLIVEQA